MRWLRTILHEILGLFVDDLTFAVAIIAWLGITWFLLPHLGRVSPWNGLILFAGLACILVESTLRAAKKGRPTHSGQSKEKP